ncbi:MAG: hypothetical protein R3E96_15985 [Planctomycetota bacterium]
MDMPATELCPGEGAHIAAAWSEETGIIVHGQEGFPPDQFAIVFRGSPISGTWLTSASEDRGHRGCRTVRHWAGFSTT